MNPLSIFHAVLISSRFLLKRLSVNIDINRTVPRRSMLAERILRERRWQCTFSENRLFVQLASTPVDPAAELVPVSERQAIPRRNGGSKVCIIVIVALTYNRDAVALVSPVAVHN